MSSQEAPWDGSWALMSSIRTRRLREDVRRSERADAGHQLDSEYIVASSGDFSGLQPFVSHFDQLPSVRPKANGQFAHLIVGGEGFVRLLRQISDAAVSLIPGAQRKINARIDN